MINETNASSYDIERRLYLQTMSEESLAQAERHVVRARRIVARQRRVIERLKAIGADTTDAEKSLRLFEANLAIFEKLRGVTH